MIPPKDDTWTQQTPEESPLKKTKPLQPKENELKDANSSPQKSPKKQNEDLYLSLGEDSQFSLKQADTLKKISAFDWDSLLNKPSPNILKEYLRFIFLKIDQNDKTLPPKLSPSAQVDALWHKHILQPVSYFKFCQSVCGEIIDHNPATEESPDRDERYQLTLNLYSKVFHSPPPAGIWPAPIPEATAAIITIHLVPADDSEEVTIRCRARTRTSQIMKAYANRKGISEDDVRILLDGKRVNDDMYLSDEGVVDGDRLDVLLAQRGC